MTFPLLQMRGVAKQFTLHNQPGIELNVLDKVDLEVRPGECVVLDGPSGMGKSTLLKLIYANYRATAGSIQFRQHDDQPALDITRATPRELVALRRHSISYVSQFLRVIPRICALDIVAEPLAEDAGNDMAGLKAARDQASAWLTRLRIPQRLWHLPPATFSGGEQQRINIARNMIKPRPLLLLDEPTASLDPANTETVIELIREAIAQGSAAIGIFHDAQVGASIATRHVLVGTFRSNA